jgi:hypothetical protein
MRSLHSSLGEERLSQVIRAGDAELIDGSRARLDRAPKAGLRRRVEALARIRTEEGYTTEMCADAGAGLLLIEHHYPTCEAAATCTSLCRSELEVFRAVLGYEVRPRPSPKWTEGRPHNEAASMRRDQLADTRRSIMDGSRRARRRTRWPVRKHLVQRDRSHRPAPRRGLRTAGGTDRLDRGPRTPRRVTCRTRPPCVPNAPYVRVSAPVAWSKIELTLRADGTSDCELVDASSSPATTYTTQPGGSPTNRP